jgi:uncharacterized Ntn-hydrolase superfamily protein
VTFSLVARCPRTGHVAVGALTAMVGVGKLACHASAQIGAVATQATTNPYLAYDALHLLAAGRPADEALAMVLAADPGREVRQVGLVDARGRVAVHTGNLTLDWSGHLVGDGCAAQGNRLVGPQTLSATVEAFLARPDLDLAERVLQALEAGEATGADREGARSATLTVMGDQLYPLWDLRVDHAPDPAAELRRLHRELEQRLLPHIARMPTRDDPLGQAAREQLEQARRRTRDGVADVGAGPGDQT